ncbi:transmembrane protein 161A [Austrofundulus limnaeus]|uniref:Transmembrane protein 161A n=1 Tax=Austrofundulus limnaeus TaxID=52670 RepID=A0A2I4AIH6_AUSLI|nr:PREDICTED: transmembrane protein 161A-like [Austrofundulus limnaeus]
MALMGVQLVVSLLAASIMQRMAPHCSFARWLLCNGSLYRFKHPSEGELCALAGKQMPKQNRKDRRQNGENKPLTVPRDIDLHLEKTPVNVMDALVLRFFLEYQWLVDFAVYAMGVFLFTECYYSVVDASKEVNIGAIWCVLTVLFGLKMLHTLMSHYFRSEEGGERSVCLAFGFLSLLVAMLVLVVREDYLEFGLEPGFSSLFDNLEIFAKQQGYADWSIPVTKLTVKLSLAAVCAYVGALLAFPGLRLAQTHLDAVQMNSDRPLIQILLHMSFLSPVVVLVLWVKPIARDFLDKAPMGKTSVTLVSSAAFDSVRLWTIVALCVLRLALTRYHLQAYLNLAQKWVEQMKKEAGRIAAIDIQRKVTRVCCYLTVVTLQYLVPVLLILFSTLSLKALGDFSWGIVTEATPGVTQAPIIPTAAPVLPGGLDEDEEEEEDVQATVAHLLEAFTALRAVLTPLFFRGLFAFFTWWVAACQLISSLFGIYFHQYLMQN